MQVGEGRICGEGEEDEEGERGGERSERDGDGVHTRTGDSAGTVRRGVCVFYDESQMRRIAEVSKDGPL